MKKTLGNIEKSEGKKGKSFLTPKRVFVGVFALGALGYGFYALTRRSNKPADDQGANLDTQDEQSPGLKLPEAKPKKATTENKTQSKPQWPKASDFVSTKPASDFPLKRGSKNEKVAQLQQALMSKYPGLIKKADGKFGEETEKVVKEKLQLNEITEAQFKVLTTIDPDTTATKLYNAAKNKQFSEVVSALSAIRSTADYKAVNDKFKPKGLVNGYNTTIVTGLFEKFTEQNQKDRLAIEFTRIGLEKGSDGKWTIPATVSGIARRTIVTTRPTKVWQNAKHMAQVGADTVLGYEVQSGEGITIFDTIDGYRLFVMTGHIKYN